MNIKKHYNFFPLKEKWRELYQNNHELSPYQSDEYAAVAFSRYLPYAVALRVIPVFFEIIDQNSTVMIVPLCKNLFENRYTLFGDKSGYGYLDFIYRNDIKQEKFEECLDLLTHTIKGSMLSINRLREDSLLCRHLIHRYEVKATDYCSHISLADCYDVYLKSLKKDWRQHIRSIYNKLQTENKIASLKIFYNDPLPGIELSRIIDLYVERKKSRYGQKYGPLYKIFIKNLDIGTAAMKKMNNYIHFILYIDDCAVAFCNGFLSQDESTITLPRLAIDAKYAAFSPGILLLNESIKKIFELGLARRIDMIEGDERYKHEMGGELHCCYEFDLQF